MTSESKYLGTPDCMECQNGDGKGKCGMNPFFNSKNVKNFDICLRFFRKLNGVNTHYKTPGVFFRDAERCSFQFIGADMEWKCSLKGDDCDMVCKERECKKRSG